MKSEIIKSLSNNFEDHSQTTENGIEFWFARDIQHLLGYSEWRNFDGLIKRAINIIIHTQCQGIIKETTSIVEIGSGAKRKVGDYTLDAFGLKLVKKLSSSQKLNNAYIIRNETIVLQLIEKYCLKKNIQFIYQFRLVDYRFDCKVGDKILIEFDEPHHSISPKQKHIDDKKNKIAKEQGFLIFRIDLSMDIVDVILFLDEKINYGNGK